MNSLAPFHSPRRPRGALRVLLGLALLSSAGCPRTDPPSDVADASAAEVGIDVNLLDDVSLDSVSPDAGPEGSAPDAPPADALDTSANALDSSPDAGPEASPDARADVLAPPPANPVLVQVSATGHDRFYGVAFDRAGHLYAVGQVADSTETTADYATIVARFDLEGALDPSWGTGGIVRRNLAVGTNGELARGIVVQSTGRVVVSATIEHAGASDARDRDVVLVRFLADGSVDTSFGTGGTALLDLSAGVASGASFVADSAWGLAVYPDDRLVLSGSQVRPVPGATDSDFATVRLTANGARDATFGVNGVVTLDLGMANASARATAILADGSIVSAGYMAGPTGNQAVLYKMRPTDGALDATFGAGGVFQRSVLTAQTESYMAAAQGSNLVTTGYGRESASESLDWLSLRVTGAGALDSTYGTAGFARVDFAGQADNSRFLLVLPDSRVLLVGGARPAADNVDGALALLTPNGALDRTFGTGGRLLVDLGGANDFLWAGAVSAEADRMAFVGVRGVATGTTGNDDAALVVRALPR